MESEGELRGTGILRLDLPVPAGTGKSFNFYDFGNQCGGRCLHRHSTVLFVLAKALSDRRTAQCSEASARRQGCFCTQALSPCESCSAASALIWDMACSIRVVSRPTNPVRRSISRNGVLPAERF